MGIWFISITTLLIYPIVSAIVVANVRKNAEVLIIFLKYSIGLLLFISLAIILKISTTSLVIDCLFISAIYFIVCIFLWSGIYRKNLFIKIISSVFAFIIFGLGYLLGTLGFLGIGFISAEYEPSKFIRLSESVVYKQYGIGNATTSRGGIRVCLFRSYQWFPVIERQIFEKKYINGLESKPDENKSKQHEINNTPSFYATDFKVRYEPVKKLVILSEPYNIDTLHLEH